MQPQVHAVRCLFLAAALLLTGCGYRAPLQKTVIPEAEDPAFGIIRPAYRELAATVAARTGLPPTAGNQVHLIPVSTDRLEWMQEQLKQAQKSIYIDLYRFRLDSCGMLIYDILAERARAGVDVRIILDKGANRSRDLKAFRELEKTGAQVRIFHFPVFVADYILPPMATMHRDHRKIILIDGELAYLGGRNLALYYFNQWKDLDVCYSGEAVAQITDVFQENWARVAPDTPAVSREAVPGAPERIPAPEAVRHFSGKTVQIIPESPSDTLLPLRDAFELVLDQAKDYFYFQSPYLPPPESTLQKLKAAARRGVDVRWMVPAKNDVFVQKWMGEYLYKGFLKSGIRVFEWEGSMIHTKLYVSDDYITCIGSANADNLSFFINYEVSSIIYDEQVACCARQIFLEDQGHCREIKMADTDAWDALRLLRNWLSMAIGHAVG